MSEVVARVPGSAEEVFAILADGWSYGHWVVGSTHMRGVDPEWPAAGARIHHSVGAWPLTIQDTTTVLAAEPPRLLELEAGLRPFGRARIRLELCGVNADTTEVRMTETVTSGPGRLIPAPLLALLLRPRNQESLARLSDLIGGRYRPAP
ncbi:SRPBCC family protein [Nocardia sp. 2]|uniref:SRPBCC family protein n=1 Tax=Nocardia acididurans TaxID=2802282 RepID=A0ABS1MIE3_9NOCA|nr:SRPBCC family protein [Nocardia acididurans]MBL1079449.1 SRPBCC family protein [Nocardia acididurans]